MTTYILYFGLSLAITLNACNTPTQQVGINTPVVNDTLPPVETLKSNTNYPPAFPGQTRIGGMKTTTPYNVEILTSKLDGPWGIANLPDGRLLITQKKGTMVIVTPTGEVSDPITGIPEVNPRGQGGLLGITLDPDFENNRMVYWAFSLRTPEGNQTAVAKGRLANDEKSIEGATVIYKANPAYNGTLHYGGRVLFDKNGYLYVSTGERSDLATRPQAQWLNSALGKILRITKDGNPAPGNPFLNNQDAFPEVWTYGHRNVQGLAINPVTGDLWSGEFGPRGGDEINLVQPGKNYGWPVITYALEYSGKTIGEGITQKEGMEQPVYYWDPVISPSGMTFYKGKNIPEWQNNLFVGGLSGSHIARLRIENNKVTGEERLLASEGQRFRDVHQGKDGNLYAVTDQGRLYKLSKK
ncbi:MAG: PQQ-dependent sugar dehydrogenase [Chitinophagaceae bacterium]|nr:PQQ-dependent sugar dehydrogenase [Chitinophagaceae bacterium]